ncbi:S1C family serine protease [Cellulomonas sp. Leaf395]|uniref:S1C family serine protease n=1 Tax=Cellulomonas sp. Leaf395 TaxID=1736362 RepID=UPI0006FA8EF5|nr:serine protease [Cellulomonas sp. Leaf395]KQS96983.1 hypothetical protein ASG23_15375 [Cellulomonas sp. Leaf395]
MLLLPGVAAVGVLVLASCTVNVGSGTSQAETPAVETTTAETATARAATWTDTIAATETGVALVTSTTCDGGGTGTAFLLSPTQLLTAAHVVDGSQDVVVELGGTSTQAHVIGFDRAGDLALIQTDAPLTGHVFRLSTTPVHKGDEVTGLGYPLDATTVVATQGRVSGLDQPVTTESFTRNDMIQTDAGLNHGSSGGPLITLDESVVGMVSAGKDDANVTGFAVPANAIANQVAGWKGSSTTTTFPACSSARDLGTQPPMSSFVLDVRVATSDPGASTVADLLRVHGTAINAGDYGVAFSDFTPKMQEYLGSQDKWGASMTSIYWQAVRVVSVQTREDGAYIADVEIERLGDPANGGECGIWTKRYTIKTIDSDPRWRIGWVEDVADLRPCT